MTMLNQVAIISAIDVKSEILLGKAIFLNSNLIYSTSPHVSDNSSELAASIAISLGSQGVEHYQYKVNESWGWELIRRLGIENGDLNGGFKNYLITHIFNEKTGDESTHKMNFKAINFEHAIEQLIKSYERSQYKLISVTDVTCEDVKIVFQLRQQQAKCVPMLGMIRSVN